MRQATVLWLALGVLILGVWAAAPAGAVILCSGPCPDFDSPGAGEIVSPEPIELPPLETELGLIIEPGADLDVQATGNVALVLSSGVLDADLIDLSANGTIDFLPGEDLSISSPFQSYCAPDCVPSDRSAGTISLRLYLPEEMGELRISALGNITLEAGTAPSLVPEPTAAVLWLAGCALVARHLRRRGAAHSA
jgi:hypothetical protein